MDPSGRTLQDFTVPFYVVLRVIVTVSPTWVVPSMILIQWFGESPGHPKRYACGGQLRQMSLNQKLCVWIGPLELCFLPKDTSEGNTLHVYGVHAQVFHPQECQGSMLILYPLWFYEH